MSFRFKCPACDASLKAREEFVGRKVRCTKCGEKLVVPEPARASEMQPAGSTSGRPATEHPSTETPPADDPGHETIDDGPADFGEKREELDGEMDMTPMVDVTFLLLIFFMVTAAFALQKSIELPKPKQDEASTNVVQQEPEEDPDFVTVSVDEFNTYRVVTIDWEAEAPSEHELLRKLREARGGDSAGNIPTKLLVKAHIESLHEKVIAALDAGTEVGMEQVQLMTVEEFD